MNLQASVQRMLLDRHKISLWVRQCEILLVSYHYDSLTAFVADYFGLFLISSSAFPTISGLVYYGQKKSARHINSKFPAHFYIYIDQFNRTYYLNFLALSFAYTEISCENWKL